jgi:hypothetical protein
MARAIQKNIARRQEQTFADWFAKLRELAGDRWPDVADQAPTVYAVGWRRDAAAGFLHGGAHSPAKGSGRITQRDGRSGQYVRPSLTTSNHGDVRHG